jgi:pyruvate, water dikinase
MVMTPTIQPSPFVSESSQSEFVLWFEQVGMGDVDRVGGKNASLGEMIQQLSPQGVAVPTGFATLWKKQG